MAPLLVVASALLALAQATPFQVTLAASDIVKYNSMFSSLRGASVTEPSPTSISNIATAPSSIQTGSQDAEKTPPLSIPNKRGSAPRICICGTCDPESPAWCCDCGLSFLALPDNSTTKSLVSNNTRSKLLAEVQLQNKIPIVTTNTTNHVTKLYASINTGIYSNFITSDLANSLGLQTVTPSTPATHKIAPVFTPESDLEAIFGTGWHAVGQTHMTLISSTTDKIYSDVPLTVLDRTDKEPVMQTLLLGTKTLNDMDALRLKTELRETVRAADQVDPAGSGHGHNEL